jgi:hypothetical protein
MIMMAIRVVVEPVCRDYHYDRDASGKQEITSRSTLKHQDTSLKL